MNNINFCLKKFNLGDDGAYDKNTGVTYVSEETLIDENYCEQSCPEEINRAKCELLNAFHEIIENKKNKLSK